MEHRNSEKGHIIFEEIRGALKILKPVEHDEITAEMVKYSDENFIEFLSKFFFLVWNHGQIPEVWEIGIIVSIR